MLFDESDVDFSRLGSVEFEELCFDFFMRVGFTDVVWRQGGSDSGRDLEGIVAVNVPVLGVQSESWAIECKHYSAGVPQDALASKISWAEAERPDRLVIVVSSHLTNAARRWLNSRRPQLPFQVHVIEGKQMKSLLLPYRDLIERYFGDRHTKLLRQTVQQWTFHGIHASPETLHLLTTNLDLAKLSSGELAFLWCMCLLASDSVEQWEEQNDEKVRSDLVRRRLRDIGEQQEESVIVGLHGASYAGLNVTVETYEPDIGRTRYVSELVVDRGGGREQGVYAFDFDGEVGLEVLVAGGPHLDGTARVFRDSVPDRIESSTGLLAELVDQTRRRRG